MFVRHLSSRPDSPRTAGRLRRAPCERVASERSCPAPGAPAPRPHAGNQPGATPDPCARPRPRGSHLTLGTALSRREVSAKVDMSFIGLVGLAVMGQVGDGGFGGRPGRPLRRCFACARRARAARLQGREQGLRAPRPS